MNREEYSPFKIIHHKDKLNDLKYGIQTIPIQVQIVPTNKCNSNCKFCAYRIKNYPSSKLMNTSDFLSYEKIIECLDSFAKMNVKAVQYTGGGEPLLHKQINNILKATLNKKLDLALVSNGILLNDELCDLLGNSCWTRISVDACTPDTYAKLRGLSNDVFYRVLNNIKKLVSSNTNSILGIGFVVVEENYKEIYDAAKLFKDIGVDNFRISAAFTPEGVSYFKNFKEEAEYLSAMAESLSDDKFTVFNLFKDRIEDLKCDIQKFAKCHMKDLQTYIGADYNIYTCCTLAYNKLGFIGSIKDKSFFDLWHSLEKINMFSNHDPRKVCKYTCMYKGKNEFIEYCVKNNPRHVNFI